MITLERGGDDEVPRDFVRHRRSDADVPLFLLEALEKYKKGSREDRRGEENLSKRKWIFGCPGSSVAERVLGKHEAASSILVQGFGFLFYFLDANSKSPIPARANAGAHPEALVVPPCWFCAGDAVLPPVA